MASTSSSTTVQQEEVLNVAREFVLSVASSSVLAPHLYRESNGGGTGAEMTGIGYRPSEDD